MEARTESLGRTILRRYRPSLVARRLGVSIQVVVNWRRRGDIPRHRRSDMLSLAREVGDNLSHAELRYLEDGSFG